MRVAITTDQYTPMLSGLVDSVETLATELRRAGHEVRVYAPTLPGSKPEEGVFRFPAWTLPGSGGGIVLTFPFGAMHDLEQFRPDVIHTHLFGMAGFLAWRAARRLKVPLVGTDHTSPADYLHYFYLNFQPFIFLVRSFASWFYARCNVVTAPSQHILDELWDYGMHHTPMQVVSNPISLGLFRPLPNKAALKEKYDLRERAVLVFGRIAEEKNLDEALEVYEQLLHKNKAQLVFVGDGPYHATLEEKIHAKKLGSQVKFLGVLRGEALNEVLNASDVLLVTSTSEIQPMTILQSMAVGLPVVGARAGGIPECIVDGDTGYLVDPGHIKEYVAKLDELLNNQEMREQMGTAAQAIAKQYEPEHITKKFIDIYKTCISR